MANFEEVDSEISKRLIKEGGTFVFLNVPPGTEFGIDMNVFNVGEKFRGIKMIPPGLHYIFFSAVNKSGDVAPRTGFFHYFSPLDVLIKKWDFQSEDISEEPIANEEMDRIRQNLQGDLNRYLGTYPYKTWKTWMGLTSYLTEQLVKKIQPKSQRICAVTQLVPLSYPETPKDTSNKEIRHPQTLEEKLLPNMETQPGTEIQFTNITCARYPTGSTPSEITRHGMDSTFILEQIIKEHLQPECLLGELQMAFVCFLLGQVYDAFEQWKKIVHVMCTSDKALELYTSLFSKFIGVLHFQLKEIPKDFFVDIVDSINFLTTTLQIFFSNVEQSKTDRAFKDRCSRFKEHLTKVFKWDFDIEPDDEQPVIVEVPDCT